MEESTRVVESCKVDLVFETADGPVHALSKIDLDINKGDFVVSKISSKSASGSDLTRSHYFTIQSKAKIDDVEPVSRIHPRYIIPIL